MNTHGRAGKNVSCDLYMEHLNREAKNLLTGLGSNITDTAISRVGKTLGVMIEILQQFGSVSKVKKPSSQH